MVSVFQCGCYQICHIFISICHYNRVIILVNFLPLYLLENVNVLHPCLFMCVHRLLFSCLYYNMSDFYTPIKNMCVHLIVNASMMVNLEKNCKDEGEGGRSLYIQTFWLGNQSKTKRDIAKQDAFWLWKLFLAFLVSANVSSCLQMARDVYQR